MKVRYHVDSGKQGGPEGLEFDTKDNSITYSHKGVEKLCAENADDVQWAINGSIKSLKATVKKLKMRMSLKADKKERIDGGYKLLKKPTPTMLEILSEKLEVAQKEIALLEGLDVNKMIK